MSEKQVLWFVLGAVCLGALLAVCLGALLCAGVWVNSDWGY